MTPSTDDRLFTTNGAGVYYYIDGTTPSPVKVNGPTDQGTPCLIGVDRSSATQGGRKSRWLIYVNGQGLYQSTTGPTGAFTLVSGTPTVEKWQMVVHANGDVYLSGSGSINKFSGGVWSVEGSAGYVAMFAISSSGKKVASDDNGNLTFTNADGSWPADVYRPNYPLNPGFTYASDDVKWLSTSGVHLFPSKLFADPVTPDKFWLTHGTGICWFMLPKARNLYDTNYGPIVLNDKSRGNAMLVTMKALSMPDGSTWRTAWDKPLWHASTDEEYDNPAGYFPAYVGVQIGSDIDYVAGNPSHLIALINQSSNDFSQSTDGGKSWSRLLNHHPDGYTAGGSIAAATDTEWYWMPANNGKAVYTLDGAQTPWQYLDLVSQDGTHIGNSGGWSFAYYFNKKNVFASKNTPGLVVAWNYGDQLVSMRGFYRKPPGSHTFTQVHVGNPPGAGVADFFYHMGITEVPGHVDDFLMYSGLVDNNDPALRRSTNGGTTWSAVTVNIDGGASNAAVTSVSAIGYGKGFPGSNWPTIRFSGRVNGSLGIWESWDGLATVRLIEARPMGMTEAVGSIAGDLTAFGRFVYGVGQQGWVRTTRDHVLTIS